MPKLAHLKFNDPAPDLELLDTDGKPRQVEVLRSSYEGFNEPAMKVIREMPDWKPGIQRGKPVKVFHVLSIKFNPPKE